jgi:N-acetylmuramoyl-L-alanine amidase CwlA
MNIIQRLIPETFDTRTGVKITPTYITIHETDNEGAKANAEAHARLQENGNSRDASWHYQVDDQYVIQSIPDCEEGWHAGNKTGNMCSIAIEICVNKDGDFKKAVANAAELTKLLMVKYNIPLDCVVQHNKWSGKNCPRHLRSGDKEISWNDFVELLQPKKVRIINFYTGGYRADSLVKLHELLIVSKWYFQPSKNADGTISFLIGGFGEGTDEAVKLENFLKENKFWYEVRNNA